MQGTQLQYEAYSFLQITGLLASNSLDGTVGLWRCDTWEIISKLDEAPAGFWPPDVAFSPTEPVLATVGERDMVIRIWDVDLKE